MWIFLLTLLLLATLSTSPALAFTSANETLLRKTIFTGYDHEVRPEEVTQVLLQFIPTSMNEINIKSGTMGITGWWIMSWNDSRLTWNPSQYDAIGETHVYQQEVWTPPIIVYNSIDNLSALNEQTIPLRISSTGGIVWTPPGILTVNCDTDITYFPFDTQTCGILITTFGYTINELTVSPQSVDTSFYSPNGEWILERTFTESNPDQYSFVSFQFQFKRKPAYYGLNLLLPVIMLWVLSVFIFLLPAESGEKMGYSLTVLLAFVVLMTLLADTMPTTADHVSYLEVYIILVLSFCGLSVGYSIVSLALYFHREDVPVPLWLQRFTAWVNKRSFRTRRVTDLPKEGAGKVAPEHSWCDDGQSAASEDPDLKVGWKHAAYAMDSLVLKVYFIVTFLFTVIFLGVMGSYY